MTASTYTGLGKNEDFGIDMSMRSKRIGCKYNKHGGTLCSKTKKWCHVSKEKCDE